MIVLVSLTHSVGPPNERGRLYLALQRLRKDLEHSMKYLTLVAQTEWAKTGDTVNLHEAARQWNKRVKIARR